jgi:hypothetical protein
MNENCLNIIEYVDELLDLSNMLTLASAGVTDTLVESTFSIVIDKIDEISYSIKEEVGELKDELVKQI